MIKVTMGKLVCECSFNNASNDGSGCMLPWVLHWYGVTAAQHVFPAREEQGLSVNAIAAEQHRVFTDSWTIYPL